MIRRRAADERGHFDFGWLDTHHTFSFGDYHDPSHMGFRHLRVINEDRVQPGKGFDTHAHWDMEILTVVLDGALEHNDSLGNGSVIRVGDVQRMSAGTGVTHSEFNHSTEEVVHFLQIWIMPDRRGLQPGYEQRSFPPQGKNGRLRLVASPEGRDDSVVVHQDSSLFDCRLPKDETVGHEIRPGRHAWLQLVSGDLAVGEIRLAAGDGAAVSDEARIEVRAIETAEFLLFDLA